MVVTMLASLSNDPSAAGAIGPNITGPQFGPSVQIGPHLFKIGIQSGFRFDVKATFKMVTRFLYSGTSAAGPLNRYILKADKVVIEAL